MEKLTGTLFLLVLVFVIVLLKAALVGMGVWFNCSFPRASARMARAYTHHGPRCFLIGVVNFILVGLVGLATLQVPGVNLIGLLLLAGLLSSMFFGLAISFRHVGEQLCPGEPLCASRVFYGALCAEALFLTPVLGQLVWLVAVFRGLGAVLSGWVAGDHHTEPADTPAE